MGAIDLKVELQLAARGIEVDRFNFSFVNGRIPHNLYKRSLFVNVRSKSEMTVTVQECVKL